MNQYPKQNLLTVRQEKKSSRVRVEIPSEYTRDLWAPLLNSRTSKPLPPIDPSLSQLLPSFFSSLGVLSATPPSWLLPPPSRLLSRPSHDEFSIVPYDEALRTITACASQSKVTHDSLETQDVVDDKKITSKTRGALSLSTPIGNFGLKFTFNTEDTI